MLFIYLYHCDLYKVNCILQPRRIVNDIFSMSNVVDLLPPQVFSTITLKQCKSPFRTCSEVDQGDSSVVVPTSKNLCPPLCCQIRTSLLGCQQKGAVVTQCCNYSSRKEHSFEKNVIISQKLFQFCCSFHSSLFLLAWISLLVIR